MIQEEKYNAAASLAGYLFQCRLALLRGLQILKKKPNGQISIEKFDDVAFDNDDIANCLIQAKHHVAPKSLSDASVDLWKTMRIWIEQFKQGALTATDLRFNLITTATANSGSAMELLRPIAGTTAIGEACKLLQQAAKDSKNKDSLPGRTAFLDLTNDEAEALLARIDVLDSHPNLVDVMDEIKGELILLSPDHVADVAAYLEGWWLGVVGKCLVTKGSASIPVQHIIVKASEIGNLFKQEGLPIGDPDALGAKEYTIDDESAIFVKQMRAVKLNEPAIHRGVQDFYRAAAQRSKWGRGQLREIWKTNVSLGFSTGISIQKCHRNLDYIWILSQLIRSFRDRMASGLLEPFIIARGVRGCLSSGANVLPKRPIFSTQRF